MFERITLHDYSRPMVARAKSRKSAGPYVWTPSKAGQGRGFYSGQDCQTAAHGAGFRLRLEAANDHLSGRMSGTIGYFCDVDESGDSLMPIVARLPGGRGFLAGWTMGAGMCGALGPDVWPDAVGAANEAHRMAERDAEASRADAVDNDDEEACEAIARAAGWSRNAHNGYFVAPIGSDVRMVDYSSWRELCDDNGLEVDGETDDAPEFPALYSQNAFGARVVHVDGAYSVHDLRESDDARAGMIEDGEEFAVFYDGGEILPGGLDNEARDLAAALAIIEADRNEAARALLRDLRDEVRDWESALDGARPSLSHILARVDTFHGEA